MKLDDRFYESPRARIQHERMMKKKAEEAAQKSEVLQRIEHEQHMQRLQQKLVFCLWFAIDKRYQAMLEQYGSHDENVQEIKNACEDLWFAYTNIDRPEYAKYI